MSYNGSGTFQINSAGQPVVSGTVISSTAFNALTADLATGLSTCITKDGQTTVTANIPMGNNKITGLAVGTAATDAANLSQVQSTAAKLINSVSGADTVTGVLSPTLGAYAAGQMFYWVAAGDNTGAVTLNIDSLGAKSVTRDGSVALAAGDIKSGEVVVVVYDGTRFQVVSQLNSSGDARFANVSIASTLYVGGVATFTSGTAAAPAITTAGDTNTGIFFPAADTIAFAEGGVEALRIDSSANVGIGTSSPAYKLDVAGTGGTAARIRSSSAYSGLLLSSQDSNAATRNWLVASNWNAYGDLAIVQSNAQNGDPITAGTTRLAIDASGNIGLGVTPSAWFANSRVIQMGSGGCVAGRSTDATISELSANQFINASGNRIYISTNVASLYEQNAGQHRFFTAPSGTAGNTISFTQAMTLDASGNLGIGTASPSTRLHVSTAADEIARFQTSGTGGYISINEGSTRRGYIEMNNTIASIAVDANVPLRFLTNATERARITSGGDLLVGTTSAVNIGGRGSRINCAQSTNGAWAGGFVHSATTGTNAFGFAIYYSGSSPNNTQNPMLYCEDSTALRAEIRSNGGLANYQSNNADLSDARTKKDITPAASMWGKIGALEIVTYKYNDQTHDDVNLGVIAQQVESVEPVWVDADGFGETPEGEEPLKTVYTKDITFAAIKALQEAMARIEQLEAKVAALESA